jgi:prepilin-type N-terminal cleavage/methylation domain-containing protein
VQHRGATVLDMGRHSTTHRRGFTFIELIVVVFVLGTLAMGVVVAVQALTSNGADAAAERVATRLGEQWDLEVTGGPTWDDTQGRWNFTTDLDGRAARCQVVVDRDTIGAVICDGREVPEPPT